MHKKIIVLLSAILVLNVTPVHAATEPTLVLIDVGINSNLYKSNVVQEVCVVENGLCPNGAKFMEGAGAANLPATTNAAFSHGTQMMSIITRVSPSAKVIPIRITGMTNQGTPYLYSLASVQLALNWVVANREKYNISVVSLSQGKVFANCAVPAGIVDSITTLKTNNVQVVASTGNDSNRTAMFSPACLPDVISVGATDNPASKAGIAWDKTKAPYIARYSNGTPATTLYANGRWIVTNLDGSTKFMVGTSNATASVASWVLKNKGVDWNSTYQTLLTNATGKASNEWLSGRYILIDN